jgi:putative ABC transport system substrate-binding protein
MQSVVQKAADESDVIYLPTDNTVANAVGIVDGICRPMKVPVIAGEEGICAGCGVATLSINYYDLGVTTGKMAVQILKGEADISTMEVQYVEQAKLSKKYNKEICDELGITPPEGYVAIEKAD